MIVPTIYSNTQGKRTLQELNLPPPSHRPPDSTSPEGGSSSLLRPVTMCTLEVPQMKKNIQHPPQKEKFAQLAPAITKFNTCPSNRKSHLHSLLAMCFPLCRTWGVFQQGAEFPPAIVGSDPWGSHSSHWECVGHNPFHHFPSRQEKS